MSGAFPTTIGFSAINFENVRPSLNNQSISGRRNTRQIGSQYFRFTCVMPTMDKDDAMDVFAFLQKQKGSFENFTIQLPFENRGADKSSTSVKVNGSHTASDGTIALDGFSTSTTAVLKAGDMIKFSGHTKVYMVQSDIDSNSSGEATVLIEPNLVTALSDNEVVSMNRPSLTVYLPNEDILLSSQTNNTFNITFDVREVIT